MLKQGLVVMALLTTHAVYAELNIPGLATQHFNTLAIQDATLAKTGLSKNEDDITSEQDINTLKLTELQNHEAKVWNLTLDEEKRYVMLMQNRSQIYYHGLRQTPVDILGINARNEMERNHFAELAAKQEAQKVSKNIAWNNAFYKAYNKLFENTPVVGDFDPKPYSPYAHKPLMLADGDVLYLFIKPNDAVKSVLILLIEAIDTSLSSHLNIMLLDSDEITIQYWANQHQIPKSLVSSGRITLNHGELNYHALTLPKKETPLLLLAKNGASNIVDLGKF